MRTKYPKDGGPCGEARAREGHMGEGEPLHTRRMGVKGYSESGDEELSGSRLGSRPRPRREETR